MSSFSTELKEVMSAEETKKLLKFKYLPKQCLEQSEASRNVLPDSTESVQKGGLQDTEIWGLSGNLFAEYKSQGKTWTLHTVYSQTCP